MLSREDDIPFKFACLGGLIIIKIIVKLNSRHGIIFILLEKGLFVQRPAGNVTEVFSVNELNKKTTAC